MTDRAADQVAEKLADVADRIAASRGDFSHPVEVVAVTKGFDGWAIRSAGHAGLRSIGENYAQELLGKREVIDEVRPVVHFIGRLQSNKVRQLADVVDVWSSVDRLRIVDELARRAPTARILVQVNTTGEEDKGGCRLEEVDSIVERATARGLVVDGLMTVGPTGQPVEAARPFFRQLRATVDRLGLAVCSMGMSADLEVAVQEGSTEVRLGTALFGQRRAGPSTRP
jgi:pyridoxal phosphate enzyme (YggS family)